MVRWPAWVYVALVALYQLKFWAVPGYLASTDGPSHVDAVPPGKASS